MCANVIWGSCAMSVALLKFLPAWPAASKVALNSSVVKALLLSSWRGTVRPLTSAFQRIPLILLISHEPTMWPLVAHFAGFLVYAGMTAIGGTFTVLAARARHE